MVENMEVVAHRGFSSIAPENTILSFAKAIQANVDMIELDVHLALDQEVVVIQSPKQRFCLMLMICQPNLGR